MKDSPNKSPADMTVDDLMTRSVVTIRPNAKLHAARSAMVEAYIRHLPVVDSRRHLLGILSDRDLLSVVDLGAVTAQEAMTPAPQTVFSDTPAYEAIAVMVHHRVGCLPVVDIERRLIGLLSTTDLLVAAHQMLAPR